MSNVPNHSEMFDRFERKLSPLWYKITGGQVGTGCGTLSDGKSLYFNGPGKREARTVPLDTANIRSIANATPQTLYACYYCIPWAITARHTRWYEVFFFFFFNCNQYFIKKQLKDGKYTVLQKNWVCIFCFCFLFVSLFLLTQDKILPFLD